LVDINPLIEYTVNSRTQLTTFKRGFFMVENTEYFKMLKRMIKGGRKRVAGTDEHDLREFFELKEFMEEQIKLSVQDQIANGKSWADIGHSLGMTRQAAFKRFSK